MIRPQHLAALMLAAFGLATPAFARQDKDAAPVNNTEASQIEMPQASAAGPGRAYLDAPIPSTPIPSTDDAAARPPSPPPARTSLMQTAGDQISRGSGSTPASQISARGQGGSGMAQLSKADLDATLAQLSPAERRVLLQAIEGTDICDNPPNVAAIVALCQTRIETRSAEFATLAERPFSAEDRLLRGDLESSVLPSVDQVIDRLARGGASSGDLSNQAIASIALGTAPAVSGRPRDEEQPDTASFGEETQALINALINQLGGRAP